jgi:hypothetical protein
VSTVAAHKETTKATRVRKSPRIAARRKNLGSQFSFGRFYLGPDRPEFRSHLGEAIVDFLLQRLDSLVVVQRLHEPIEAPGKPPFKRRYREFAKTP